MRIPNVLANLGLASLLACAGVATSACTNPDHQPASQAQSLNQSSRDEVRPASFSSGGLAFDAVLQLPARARLNNWGVVLIGGGLGNDLDWSVPGSIESNGTPIQLTMNGQSHADAPMLSHALAEQGFTVLRWSTIARGDPLADQWPVRATPRSLAELTDQARAAIAELRRASGVAPDRIILVGHSLGAARASTVAAEDLGVRALVLLSPAYFTNEGKPLLKFAEARLRFGEEVVRERGIPCLALFGAQDTSKVVHGAATKLLAGTPGFERLDVRIIDGVGHQLGPQQGELVGPMSADIAAQVADWAVSVTRIGF